ncbi:hypothetical protein [Campylobacter showae]|jgi:hypothetical protein|uniref:Uncharacterized protein n=1 Tax=Campylobacter showae CC57C TaxID=1073353 RepID=M3IJT8_9BACT|nr:hypothetical protein [Campylobacter showae]EMG30341.1 hypothetical protein H740_07039 [Campylobacter showae CC57C]
MVRLDNDAHCELQTDCVCNWVQDITRPEVLIGNGYELHINNNTESYRPYLLPYALYHIHNGSYYKSILFELSQKGSIFWLDKTGKICHLRNNEVKNVNKKDMAQLLAGLLRRKIYVFQDYEEYEIKCKKENEQHSGPITTNILSQSLTYQGQSIQSLPENSVIQYNNIFIISELFIVEGERFDIYGNSGFIQSPAGDFYKNIFMPTVYLNNNKRKDFTTSVILQYIYYLSDYNINKFNYIMNWLSSFVKNISIHQFCLYSLDSILIFSGSNTAVIDIFLNKILKPLFGQEYCLEINDNTFKSKDIKNKLQNKLLYSFTDITSETTSNMNRKNMLEQIIGSNKYSGTIFMGKKIIITKERCLFYKLNCEYAVFEVTRDINNFKYRSMSGEIHTVENIESDIYLDLANFSNILRAYITTSKEPLKAPKDIDITKPFTEDDSISEFVEELLNNTEDYIIKFKPLASEANFKDIEKLYCKHKMIERKYVYQLFKSKYNFDISSHRLYKKLSEINNYAFKMRQAPGGAKCFYFPDKIK